MKKRKPMKIFWVRKFYHVNEKEREILETLLWILTILLPLNVKNYFLW